MSSIILQSSDNKQFCITIEVAKYLGTIKNLLSCCGTDSEAQSIIPLQNIDGDTLNKVLAWVDHKKNNPTSFIHSNEDHQTLQLTHWDKEFLDVKNEVLFKLLIAANYLDISGLIHITSKKIATMMEGKTPQEIRDTFNIKNDLSREEEEKIWLENSWL